MSKSKQILMLATVFVFLALNWLTFHDIFEGHTWTDWLLLFGTILVFWYFVLDLSKKRK